jgi:hypothetical protein
LSVSLVGVGIYSSTFSISFNILSTHLFSPSTVLGFFVKASTANKADPVTIGISSPGNS